MSGLGRPGTGGLSAPWPPPRGRVRADVIYLGWQPVPAAAEPGPPPPRPPALTEPDGVSADWAAAQRRLYLRLSRPSRLGGAASLMVTAGIAVAWLTGIHIGRLVVLGAAAAACVAARCAGATWRERRALVELLRAEDLRVAAVADAQRRQLAAAEEQYTRAVRAWKQCNTAMRHQPRWYPVTLPTTVHRVDIAGGTLAGWSAVVTMIAAPRLAAGGDVMVLDLSEGGVATDLLAVASTAGVAPLVWILPADLPQFELGTRLAPAVLADVLAQTVHAADGPAGPGPGVRVDPAGDAALIGAIFRALGGHATMPQLIAALRALGQIGGPAEHLGPAGLARAQLAGLNSLAGRAGGHIAAERAWAIEARLRGLEALGTSVVGPRHSRLTVAWLDRRAAVVSNAALAAYLAIALTAELRQAPRGARWERTICLLGAERLPGDVLDRLCEAAEAAGAGLALCYRSIPVHLRDRLGRGDAAVGFMRLGNPEDARFAAEHIGTEHRFVISQLTDTVGASITDTLGTSYTSTVGNAHSVTESDSFMQTAGRSHGRSRPGAFGPSPVLDSTGSASLDTSSSAAVGDSRTITAGISTGTSWGWTTSRAVGGTDSAARTMQRSRESIVEQHELQQLPQSAVLLYYPAPGGRQVLLADANPAIIGLPTATLATRPPSSAVRPS
jgi:hypothetical protein